MEKTNTQPSLSLAAFRCPHCSAYASMDHRELWKRAEGGLFDQVIDEPLEAMWGQEEAVASINAHHAWSATLCAACDRHALWIGTNLIYPATDTVVDSPNPDLPDAARELYREAAAVLAHSRRAAAALCRAALEAFARQQTPHMSSSARLDDRLVELSKDLPSHLADLLDTVRHVGNVSLHGARDDDQSVVMFLDESDNEMPTLFFAAINLLADELVTKRRRVQEIKDALPDGVKETIERKRQAAREQEAGG